MSAAHPPRRVAAGLRAWTKSARALGRRRTRLGMSVAAVAATTAAILGVGGVSFALWSDAVGTDEGGVRQGLVAFGAGRVGSVTYATSATDTLEVSLGPADAARILANRTDGIAIPIDVPMRADGDAGIDYSIVLPSFADGTILGGSRVRVFPVESAAACVPGATGATGALLDRTGIDNAYASTATAIDHWCLTAVWSPDELGAYTNTGTVSGTAENGAVVEASGSWSAAVKPDAMVGGFYTNTATGAGTWDNGLPIEGSDSWSVATTPDPRAEPVVDITFTHDVTRPAACTTP